MIDFTKLFRVAIKNEDEELALLQFLHEREYHWLSGVSLIAKHYFHGMQAEGGYDVYECDARTKSVARSLGTRSGVPMYSVNEVLV